MMHLVVHFQEPYYHWMRNVVVIVEHQPVSKMNVYALNCSVLMLQVVIALPIDQLQKVHHVEMDR